MPILAGIATLLLAYFVLKGFVAASPTLLAKTLKKSGALVLLGLAALLLLRGAIVPAAMLAGFALWLLGVRRGPFARFGGSGTGAVSRVRSAMIEMELDRATGAIRGVVLAGPEEGKSLDQLTREQLSTLYRRCVTNDPEGSRLLEAYFDRRFSGWRGAAQGQKDARRAGGSAPRRPSSISEDEAYEILGLKKGAGAGEIARAHRELMKKLHPDLGGTTDLAARVNEAKDVLMRRHHS